MINSKYVALAREEGERPDIWCEVRGLSIYSDEHVVYDLWVINGEWLAEYDYSAQYIINVNQHAIIVWEGNVPFKPEEYNEAISFIEDLHWSEDMTDKKLSYVELQEREANAAHNNNLINLNEAHKRLVEEVINLQERIAMLVNFDNRAMNLLSKETIDNESAKAFFDDYKKATAIEEDCYSYSRKGR